MDGALLFWSEVVLLIVLLLAVVGHRQRDPYFWLYTVFFFSGFPALVYQIVWQRALLDVYGVNIESVTIIVTAFMLGLALGSLFGGWISSKKRAPLLVLFAATEFGIAAYGLISLRLFHWVALFTAGASLFKTSIYAFVLVLVPTLLMGSTLPMLVAYTVRLSNNVGLSVGRLYSVNTLGSAVACFVSADVLMRLLGQAKSVTLAALMNSAVGAAVLLLFWIFPKQDSATARESTHETASSLSLISRIPFALALGVAACSGFIALGYEIIWYRIFSFTLESLARSFAVVLGSYLAGIALGSRVAEAFCRKYLNTRAQDWVRLTGIFVIGANAVGFGVIPCLAYTSRWVRYNASLPLVALAAALLGAVFPFIAHASIRPGYDSGAKVSYLYLSNIVGSASGSFVVGFIAMDLWPLSRIALALALLGVLLGAILLLSSVSRPKVLAAVGACAGTAGLMVLLAGPLFGNLYEKLCFKKGWRPQSPRHRFDRVVETKSGIITVTPGGLVYGDGSLEARASTDLKDGSNFNFLAPPFALGSFHSHPKEVLMIGAGIGSWAEIVANHPYLEKLTIVEINPGYLQLIPLYPQVAGLLRNSKAEIIIDDGRRWLLRNPEKKFDLLVMNTPMHWRTHVSSLLSVEFLQLVRRHLRPGGIFFYNVSFSERALLTGVTVFPYGLRIRNCLAVSDSPIELDLDGWKKLLLQYKIEGQPVFNMEMTEDQVALEKVLSVADLHPATEWDGMAYAEGIRSRYSGLAIITDDNMGDEWIF
ncbi:MAG TPA: spermidine synthase [Candidatus Angelobacter sp.]|nr:spermidine synthase [Candidatus Angelobacter sp.]